MSEATKTPNQAESENHAPLVQAELLVNSPILDTLWQRCFWEVADEMKNRGCDTIEFYDVDQLVIEKSKMALPDFIKWLGC